LWALIDHGPGISGTYRITLPYSIVHAKQRDEREAISPSFELSYGDLPLLPPGRLTAAPVALTVQTGSGASPAAALQAKLLTDATSCVADARKRLPWLRGRFTLHVYQDLNPTPTLYVSASTLGDPAVNRCLGAIQVPGRVPDRFTLTLALSPP
jgi:hypothetical protein